MYGYFFARRFWHRGSIRGRRTGLTTNTGNGVPGGAEATQANHCDICSLDVAHAPNANRTHR